MWDPVNGPIPPMLATPVEKAFDSLEYLFEIKWDGYRAIAFLGGETRLQSRRLRDITGEFPGLGGLHTRFPGTSMTLDGEIVVMRGGRPDFQALQHRQGPAVYVAFDILALNGKGLLDHPLVERKRVLIAAVGEAAAGEAAAGEAIVGEATLGDGAVGDDKRIAVAPFFPGAGVSLFEAAVERGLEGIVAKSRGSPYLPGARTAYWKKVRCSRTVDCVIGGVSSGAGSPLGSLALGLYAGHDLIYTGHTGTGFSERERERLLSLFTYMAQSPFTIVTRRLPPRLRGVRWVKPDMVCEVSYTEMTDDLKLRHPSYQRLRDDKSPLECTFDQVEPRGIRWSHMESQGRAGDRRDGSQG